MKNWQVEFAWAVTLVFLGTTLCTFGGIGLFMDEEGKIAENDGLTPKQGVAVVIWFYGFLCCLVPLLRALGKISSNKIEEKSG
jgi:hypothetical protein